MRVYRVAFRYAAERDPRLVLGEHVELSGEEVSKLRSRLDRLDAASPHGAWTRETLALIASQPAVVSTKLAQQLGRERMPFKADVRKLKAMGLTISLEVGYRLSPRGEALLRRMQAEER
jgi:hypothetical protein